jgi:hypothetical protein
MMEVEEYQQRRRMVQLRKNKERNEEKQGQGLEAISPEHTRQGHGMSKNRVFVI